MYKKSFRFLSRSYLLTRQDIVNITHVYTPKWLSSSMIHGAQSWTSTWSVLVFCTTFTLKRWNVHMTLCGVREFSWLKHWIIKLSMERVHPRFTENKHKPNTYTVLHSTSDLTESVNNDFFIIDDKKNTAIQYWFESTVSDNVS